MDEEVQSGTSLIYIGDNKGPKAEPHGTPDDFAGEIDGTQLLAVTN